MDLQTLDAPQEIPGALEPILDDSKITLSLVIPNGETINGNIPITSTAFQKIKTGKEMYYGTY